MAIYEVASSLNPSLEVVLYIQSCFAPHPDAANFIKVCFCSYKWPHLCLVVSSLFCSRTQISYQNYLCQGWYWQDLSPLELWFGLLPFDWHVHLLLIFLWWGWVLTLGISQCVFNSQNYHQWRCWSENSGSQNPNIWRQPYVTSV